MAILSTEHALRLKMTGNTVLNAAIGGRVYMALEVPERVRLPYVTVTRSGSNAVPSLTGQPGYVLREVEIRAYAETHDACVSLCEKIRAAIDGQTGTVLYGGDECRLDLIRIDEEEVSGEPPQDGGLPAVFAGRFSVKTAHPI